MTTMEIKLDLFPNLPERLTGLGELAMNLWWSWHPAARMLFKMLDRQVWKESVHNPVRMLKELPGEVLESAAKDPEYQRHYDVVLAQFREDKDARESCLVKNGDQQNSCTTIAYFSAEYRVASLCCTGTSE